MSDRCVSATHARLAATPTGFEVVDLESRNGTLVDGVPVQRHQLRDGASLLFGGCAAVFRFLSQDAVAAITADLQDPFGPVPTASPLMAQTMRRLRRLAVTGEALLLTGETGTGKEVYARAVHRVSGRQGKFVGLNCAAIPTELVESELFGYARGAHSQAAQAKRGLVEEADGGTLFLDEIADMPRQAQAKVLRFLQEGEFLPLGSSQPRRVNVRVLAATAQLSPTTEAPGLRTDLRMRLGSQPIALSPLRERPEDLGALAHHFLGMRAVAFDSAALLALCMHSWPGNVRELEKVVREAAILCDGDGPITLEHLPNGLGARLAPPSQPRKRRRRSPRPAPTREELNQMLSQSEGRVADVARLLDCRWSVVWSWLKRYDLAPDDHRTRK